MRNPDPKVALLRRLPCLSSCTDKQLAELASTVDECRVAAGQTLTREGEIARETFVVVEGWAAVIRDGEAVAAIGPGEFIGEMAMLARQPRCATVVAKTSMRLLVIGPATFRTIADRPDIGHEMAVVAADRSAENGRGS